MSKLSRADASTERSDTSYSNIMTTSDRESSGNQSRKFQVDGSCISLPLPTDVKVEICTVTDASELPYYKDKEDRNNTYKYSPKGHVLIINNKKFDHLEERTGTDEDMNYLKWLFGKEYGYGYKIHCKENLEAKQMMKAAGDFANSVGEFAKNDHKGKDCCIVVVLSHGTYDELAGKDYRPIIEESEEIVPKELKEAYRQLTKKEYCEAFEQFVKAGETYNPLAYGRVNIHDFLDCFKTVKETKENKKVIKAEHLFEKPKLFFFQACRGRELSKNFGTADGNKPSTGSSASLNKLFSGQPIRKTKPVGADFVVCYPTALNDMALRGEETGSWLITAICYVFNDFAPKEDLLSMLTRVNRLIAQQDCHLKNDGRYAKQSSEFFSRLTKKFYFFPGITSEGSTSSDAPALPPSTSSASLKHSAIQSQSNRLPKTPAPISENVRVDIAGFVQILINKGADLNKKLILESAKNQSYEQFFDSILQKLPYNFEDEDGGTILHIAAFHGYAEAAEYLLERQFDIGAKDKKLFTPLHYACQEGRSKVAELLLDKGADPNVTAENGLTPLHCASGKGHYEEAEFLLEKGANPNAKDKYRSTPLHYAREHGHCRVADLLEKNGADRTAKDQYGRTPARLEEIHRSFENNSMNRGR